MNTTSPIVIDQVKAGENLNEPHPDILEIEWFENKKQKLTRTTKSGQILELRLENRKEWNHGDHLYSNDQLIAMVEIKTCLTICFSAKNDTEAADFCYFIGNQHLPIFLIRQQQFAVPYDGRLYEQLFARYGTRIELTDNQLLSSQSLRYLAKNKAHEN